VIVLIETDGTVRGAANLVTCRRQAVIARLVQGPTVILCADRSSRARCSGARPRSSSMSTFTSNVDADVYMG
jgi:hypothetical protein